jgi:hypothetical protein
MLVQVPAIPVITSVRNTQGKASPSDSVGKLRLLPESEVWTLASTSGT